MLSSEHTRRQVTATWHGCKSRRQFPLCGIPNFMRKRCRHNQILSPFIYGTHYHMCNRCVPYLPAYRLHFCQWKNVQNLGCGLYAGTRVLSSLICKISRHTHRVNKVTESLTVWLNVSYEVKLIHVFEEFCFSLLQWVYLVSEYVCYWMKSNEVCMSSREALSMPFTWDRICLFAELHEKYTEPVIKRKGHKWNWYKISQFRSLIHIVMSSATFAMKCQNRNNLPILIF